MNATVNQSELKSDLRQNVIDPKLESGSAIFNSLYCWLKGTAPQASARQTSARQTSARQPASCTTNAEAIQIIKQFEGFPADVEPNVAEAERMVRQLVTVPLTLNQFSALVSFTYQLGASTLKQSELLKQLNAGHYRAAAKEFELWIYVGSSRFPKLVARRIAERRLFLAPCAQ